MIIDQLIKSIKIKGNPTVVGLDPQPSMIPDCVLKPHIENDGQTLAAMAAAFLEFNKAIIDKVYDLVPGVKIQIAMYEQLGAAGIRCYIDTAQYAKAKGLIVIGDIKRSDIASTAACYSAAHIGRVQVGESSFAPFDSDFVTINPYLGEDSISPFLKDCKDWDKGLFLLVKTSNPGGGLFQNLMVDDSPLYELVGAHVAKIGADFVGECGYSAIGAVVGATYPQELKRLRELMPQTFFLIPGYGAQGGSAADIADAFDKDGIGAVVNSSRGILAAYQNKQYQNLFAPSEYMEAARAAALDMKADLAQHIQINYEIRGW